MKKNKSEKKTKSGKSSFKWLVLCVILFAAFVIVVEPNIRSKGLDVLTTSTKNEATIPIQYSSAGLLKDHTEKGEQFRIRKEDFYNAVAGSGVKILKIHQINEKNKVEMWGDDYWFTVKTEKDDAVEFAVEIKGEAVYSTITLKSDLKVNHVLNEINYYVPLLLGLWLLIIIYNKFSKIYLRKSIIKAAKQIEANRTDIDKAYNEHAVEIQKKTERLISVAKGQAERLVTYYKGQLRASQIQELGITQYLNDGSGSRIDELRNAEKKCKSNVGNNIGAEKFNDYTEEVARGEVKAASGKRRLKDLHKSYREKLDESERMKATLNDAILEYNEVYEKVAEENSKLGSIIGKIEKLISEPITSDLIVRFGAYIGAFSASDKGGQLYGSYPLDDVMFIVTGAGSTLSQLINEKTELSIKGFSNEIGKGLKIYGSKTFEIRKSDSYNLATVSEIDIYEGQSYYIKICEGELKLEVKSR